MKRVRSKQRILPVNPYINAPLCFNRRECVVSDLKRACGLDFRQQRGVFRCGQFAFRYVVQRADGLWPVCVAAAADENHPQGHSRFEPFVSLFIALTMTIAGSCFLNGIQRFLAGLSPLNQAGPTVVLPGAALVKLGCIWWCGVSDSRPTVRPSMPAHAIIWRIF